MEAAEAFAPALYSFPIHSTISLRQEFNFNPVLQTLEQNLELHE